MKWMLGQDVVHRSTNKSDVKRWPFDNLSGGAPVCQRSYSDTNGSQYEPSDATPRPHKILVRTPGDNRAFHNTAKRRSVASSFAVEYPTTNMV